MNKKIILIGAGGHAASCIEVIKSKKKFKISCLVSNKKNQSKNLNYNIVDKKNFLKKDLSKKNILIAIGQLKDGNIREKNFNFFKKKLCIFPTITASSCIISKNASIGEGTIVMHYAFINYNSSIGKNCIINTRATIEHDCIIEDNVHIAPGAIILGGSTIKKNSFVGSGAVVKQSSVIKPNTIIPAKKYFR